MNNAIKALRNQFKKYDIDGYIVPKNDDYFNEYSRVDRLEFVSKFTGSAGLAVILKKRNYLFIDGRYTIQSQIESGKDFKIINYEKLINCNLFKNLKLGIDPRLFTYKQIKKFFLRNNNIKFLDINLVDEIKIQKEENSIPFFSLKKNVVGENSSSKINKICNFLKKTNQIISL